LPAPLNNGTADSTAGDAHFLFRDPAGVTVTITLYLDDYYYLTGLDLYGSHQPSNGLPGSVEGVTISVGGQVMTLETEPFGFETLPGRPVNDHGDLLVAGFSGVAVNEVALSRF